MLLTLFKPLKFHGKSSFEVRYQKNYEEMCLILTQKMNVVAKKMTTLEFYSAFELLKKQQPKKK